MKSNFGQRNSAFGPSLAGLIWLVVLAMAIVPIVVALAGCTSTPDRPQKAVDVTISRDVPQILRDTIGAQATLSGMEPVLCSGYGLVVGLNNTGSTEVPLNVRAVMEQEMLRLGVGRGDGPLADITPAQLIRDKNTAVVLVQAVIPPAAPDGERFDVKVSALPGTAVTSLEGGRLYTTNLYQGIYVPGGPATDPIATARGEVFINPFLDPADSGGGTVDKTVGRILGGGVVATRFSPILVLDNASHSRARAIAAAINERFPQRSSQDVVGRGKNDEAIEIFVPPDWKDRTAEFFKIIEHLRVDRTFPEEWARRYAEALKDNPDLADELKWCLVAVGDVSKPFVRSLYAHPERVPRMAALEAGARLGDPLTRPHLEEIALDGPPALRSDAIQLLGRLPSDPRINTFLRDLLGSPDLDVRVAAYEALDTRYDLRIDRIQMKDKFRVDIVESSEPMVYVTQQGTPKIVLFGDLEVTRPTFVSGWDGRLLISSEGPTDKVRTFFRDYRTTQSEVHELGPSVEELIEYFAHETTPERPAPGLDFSYSETVGALYEVVQGGGIDAIFVPEIDRLALELLRSTESGEIIFRPELSEDEDWDPSSWETVDARPAGTLTDPDPAQGDAPVDDEERDARRGRYVVPLGGQGGK